MAGSGRCVLELRLVEWTHVFLLAPKATSIFPQIYIQNKNARFVEFHGIDKKDSNHRSSACSIGVIHRKIRGPSSPMWFIAVHRSQKSRCNHLLHSEKAQVKRVNTSTIKRSAKVSTKQYIQHRNHNFLTKPSPSFFGLFCPTAPNSRRLRPWPPATSACRPAWNCGESPGSPVRCGEGRLFCCFMVNNLLQNLQKEVCLGCL